MRPQRSTLAGVGFLVLTALLAGCSSIGVVDAAEVKPQSAIRLLSELGMRLVPAVDQRPSDAAACAVSAVEGTVERIGADTVHFSSFRVIHALGLESDCRWAGGAYVLMSASPDLTFASREVSGGRSAGLVLLLVLVPLIVAGLSAAALGSLWAYQP